MSGRSGSDQKRRNTIKNKFQKILVQNLPVETVSNCNCILCNYHYTFSHVTFETLLNHHLTFYQFHVLLYLGCFLIAVINCSNLQKTSVNSMICLIYLIYIYKIGVDKFDGRE